MKNSTKLASAALVAAIGFGALAPQAVKAEGNQLTGKGKVEFTSEASTGTTTPTITGGSNGASNGSGLLTDSSAGTGTNVDAFGVSYVSNLDFDKHNVITSNASAESYWAKTWVAGAGTTGEIKDANFIKFKDTRSTPDHSYQVSARLTKQFTTTVGASNTEVALNGATIVYNNPNLSADEGTDISLSPSAGLVAGAEITDQAQTPVLTNTNTASAALFNTGYGEWTLRWGTLASGSNESIQLKIPRGTQNSVIQTGQYNAEITWYMADTPL